jgi:hypothetical protein
MLELLEILGYFTFFWLFLFSKSFRALQVQEWRNGGLWARSVQISEALFSLVFGVALPVAIVTWVVASLG